MSLTVKPRTYMVQVASNCEAKVKAVLLERVSVLKLESMITDIRIPQHLKTVRKKDGSTKTMNQVLYPGYIFLDACLDTESYDAVLSTPHVISFVGAKQLKGRHVKPVPLKPSEVAKIFKTQQAPVQKPSMVINVGDSVEVNDGPFSGYTGEVTDVTSSKLRLLLEIFGRETTVEVEPSSVTLKGL